MHFLQLLLPDFALILCGYLVCRYTALDRTVWQQVESLVYFFLFPVLLFQSIVRSPLDLGATSSLIGAGLLLGVSGIAMAYALPHLPVIGRHIEKREHAGAAQVAFRFNSYIALALSERLAGAQGLLLIAFSALPTASSCYVLAARMGYNGGYVAGLVTLSTLLGMASLPFALGLLLPPG